MSRKKSNPRIVVGDRVVITDGVREATHKRPACPHIEGLHGIVSDEDGWGFCTVEIDGGSRARLWNVKDLRKEDENAK